MSISEKTVCKNSENIDLIKRVLVSHKEKIQNLQKETKQIEEDFKELENKLKVTEDKLNDFKQKQAACPGNILKESNKASYTQIVGIYAVLITVVMWAANYLAHG